MDYQDVLFRLERINKEIQEEKKRLFNEFRREKKEDGFLNVGAANLKMFIAIIPFLKRSLREVLIRAPFLENFLKEEQVVNWIKESEILAPPFVFKIEEHLGRQFTEDEIAETLKYRTLIFKINLATEYYKAKLFNQNIKVVFKEQEYSIKRANKKQAYIYKNLTTDTQSLFLNILELKRRRIKFEHKIMNMGIDEIADYLESSQFMEVDSTLRKIDELLDK